MPARRELVCSVGSKDKFKFISRSLILWGVTIASPIEQGFSLNEGNRQAHEVDADNISAKLLSDRPVERFGQTVNDPGLAAQLQIKAIAMIQAKCSQCEDNQPGFVQQLMPKQIATQAKSSSVVQGKCSKCEATEQSQTKANGSQTPANPIINFPTSSSNGKQIPNSNAAPTILAMNPKGQCIELKDLPAWEQKAQQAQRTGGDALDQFCYDLSQLIEDCHGDLGKRLREMLDGLRRGQQLFRHRRYMRDHPEGNTWEGHQLRYQNTQTATKRLIEWWYDNCGDGPDGEYFLPVIEPALIAANTPAPQEPLPENNQTLLERALQLGAQFRDGALWVGKGIAKGVLSLLIIIAASLGIPLYQENF
jgi:hypothetical protein